jgi:hypothetical protein
MESKKWGAGAEPWTGRKPPHPLSLTRVEKAISLSNFGRSCKKVFEKY